jgi:hypothetical protein
MQVLSSFQMATSSGPTLVVRTGRGRKRPESLLVTWLIASTGIIAYTISDPDILRLCLPMAENSMNTMIPRQNRSQASLRSACITINDI